MNENEMEPVVVDPRVPERKKGITRIIAATGYSIKGLKWAVAKDVTLQQEFMAFAVLFPLALWLGDSNIERVLLSGSLVLVILIELLNTAIETVVNRIGLDYNELSGLAKDLGSAAVFISIGMVIFTWGMLLL